MTNNQRLASIVGLGAIFWIASRQQTTAQYEQSQGYYSSYGNPGGYGITVSQDVPGYYNTNYQTGVYSPFVPFGN